jgi:hypothetical protein
VFDLFLGDAGVACALAVLRKDELAAAGEPGSGQPQLALIWGDADVRSMKQGKAGPGVRQNLRYQRPDSPPIARRTGGSTRLGDGIAIAKQALIRIQHLRTSFRSRHLAKTRHGIPPVAMLHPNLLQQYTNEPAAVYLLMQPDRHYRAPCV